jgi:hypothetical protein
MSSPSRQWAKTLLGNTPSLKFESILKLDLLLIFTIEKMKHSTSSEGELEFELDDQIAIATPGTFLYSRPGSSA